MKHLRINVNNNLFIFGFLFVRFLKETKKVKKQIYEFLFFHPADRSPVQLFSRRNESKTTGELRKIWTGIEVYREFYPSYGTVRTGYVHLQPILPNCN